MKSTPSLSAKRIAACTQRALHILLLIALCFVNTSVAEGSAEPRFTVTVPAGDLKTALQALHRQAHVEFLYDEDRIAHVHTSGIKGVFSAREALNALLDGTPLTFEIDQSGVILILNRPAPAVPARTPPQRHASTTAVGEGESTSDSEVATKPEQVVISGPRGSLDIPLGAFSLDFSPDQLIAPDGAGLAGFTNLIPQAFGGGPNQDTSIGFEAQTNSGRGIGFNLRGLGARETLVLIDGRRAAPSGTNGEFVDIANIPIAALQQIQVVPNLAPARYGPDAIAGSVNYVMLQHFSGIETRASLGAGTGGGLASYQVAQTLGIDWDSGDGVLCLEFLRRGGLPAIDRRYAVSNLLPLGGGNFDSLFTNPGNVVVGSQTWAIPRGQDGQHLKPSQLIANAPNQQNLYQGAQIIPDQERFTAYARGQQHLADPLILFTEVLLGHRVATEALGGEGISFTVPLSNPFHVNPGPTSLPELLDYNLGKDLGPLEDRVAVNTTNVTLGLSFGGGNSWQLKASINVSTERENEEETGSANETALERALADPNPKFAFDPFGDGSFTNADTLNTIRSASRFSLESRMGTLDVALQGEPWRLAAGPVSFAAGVAARTQYFGTSQAVTFSDSGVTSSGGTRNVLSTYLQWNVPVVGASNKVPWITQLDVAAAIEYERYSDASVTAVPQFGAVWLPREDLRVRATWSRAQRPPTLGDFNLRQNLVAPVVIPNPTPPGGSTTALVALGNDANAKNEVATNQTIGLDFTPGELPELTLAATYFDIVVRNRLDRTVLTTSLLTDPHFASLVTQNPTAAQVQAICKTGSYTAGTREQCDNYNPGVLIDLRLHNLAEAITRGIDFRGSWRLDTRYGVFQLALDGTYVLKFSQKDTPNALSVSYLNTQNEPVDLRWRTCFQWGMGNLHLLGAINFTNSYHDIGSVPERRVSAWITVDTQLRYDFPTRPTSWLTGLQLELDALNVFNTNPPFLNNAVVGIGYDQENANPYGRVISLTLKKHW